MTPPTTDRAVHPRTAKARIFACPRCQAPAVSSAWSGDVELRCRACDGIERRTLRLDSEGEGEGELGGSGSPYRDGPPPKLGATVLPMGIGALHPRHADVAALDEATLRDVIARAPKVPSEDAEWECVWLAAWLAWKRATEGDPLRARMALEEALEVTRTPAYRALLLARLSQHAAAIGAVPLAKKWLRARPRGIETPEVDDEVRVARAMIHLAKKDLDEVLRITGEREAGAGFRSNAVFLAIALNIEARARLGDERSVAALFRAAVRDRWLDHLVVAIAGLGVGRDAWQRYARRERQRHAVRSAAVTAAIVTVLGAFGPSRMSTAVGVAVVAATIDAAFTWAIFGWAPATTRLRAVRAVCVLAVAVAVASIAALWLGQLR